MDAEWVQSRIDACEGLLREFPEKGWTRTHNYYRGMLDAYEHMLKELLNGR